MDEADRTASLMTPAKLAQARPRASSSPAAWLDQMAADAGHAHVRRLADLCVDLQAQALGRDASLLAGELSNLGEALSRLDFSLLQTRGWWAKASGKSRSASAEFAAQFEQIDQLTQATAVQLQALQKKQQEQGASADLAVVELEVEFRAVDKIIDQGARWLHDMRNQLKARQAEAGGDESRQRQIKDDAARCEILVARLKSLRAVSSAAQQSHQHAQAVSARHLALLQMLQQVLAVQAKAWRARLAVLAAAASDTGSPALSLEAPEETHRELRSSIKQAMADSSQLRTHEKALAESLGELGVQLGAVSSSS